MTHQPAASGVPSGTPQPPRMGPENPVSDPNSSETTMPLSGPTMIFSTPQPWPRGCHPHPLWGLVKE